jgi:hypothetical protein
MEYILSTNKWMWDLLEDELYKLFTKKHNWEKEGDWIESDDRSKGNNKLLLAKIICLNIY